VRYVSSLVFERTMFTSFTHCFISERKAKLFEYSRISSNHCPAYDSQRHFPRRERSGVKPISEPVSRRSTACLSVSVSIIHRVTHRSSRRIDRYIRHKQSRARQVHQTTVSFLFGSITLLTLSRPFYRSSDFVDYSVDYLDTIVTPRMLGEVIVTSL